MKLWRKGKKVEENKNQDTEDQKNFANDLDVEELNSEDLIGDDLWKDAQEAAQEIKGSASSSKENIEGSVRSENKNSSETVEFSNAKVSLLKNELEAKDNQLKRMAADFDNFRRRQSIEREELLKNGGKDLIIDLLPVLDNFERAMTSSKDAKDVANVISGVEMIQKQLLESIRKNGVDIINSMDSIFDPNYHEAVQQLVDDSKPDQTVINELQKGYTLNGKVIRPATVVVSTVSS